MLPLIELFIDEDKIEDGIEAISLVHDPAIEEHFIALSKQDVQLKTIDEEKRIIISLALIPEKRIYRRDKQGNEYEIKFSKETVRKAAELYMARLNNNNATLEHGEERVEGISVIESWVVEDVKKDKTAIYNLNAVEGAWAVIMKINNDEAWKDIKDGKYQGISIEGRFSEKETALKEVEMESYNDYPQGARNNAKRAIEWKEKNGSDCGTQVGWTRAGQLARGENISRKTIARMASFKRHQQNKDVPYSEGCGGLMWDAWGGSAGINWAINKLKKIDMTSEEEEILLDSIREILKD